jgi:hypothetical protein
VAVKPVTTWYEVNPGGNTPPKVRHVGRIAYDDRFLYAAFEFDDPNPHAIRAPYSDRDDSGGGESAVALPGAQWVRAEDWFGPFTVRERALVYSADVNSVRTEIWSIEEIVALLEA